MINTVTALIFDYGNVLCEPQRKSDIEAMAANFGVDPSRFETAYWLFREPYDRADVDGIAYWNQVADHLGCSVSAEQMQKQIQLDSEGWGRPNHGVLEWVAQLLATGAATSLLSNMPPELRHYVELNCHWMPNLDHRVYSCDLRCNKPESEIYQHCLQLLSVEPEEALFIDDREVNCEAARAIGMHTLLFTTLPDAISQVGNRFLLRPSNSRLA